MPRIKCTYSDCDSGADEFPWTNLENAMHKMKQSPTWQPNTSLFLLSACDNSASVQRHTTAPGNAIAQRCGG